MPFDFSSGVAKPAPWPVDRKSVRYPQLWEGLTFCAPLWARGGQAIDVVSGRESLTNNGGAWVTRERGAAFDVDANGDGFVFGDASGDACALGDAWTVFVAIDITNGSPGNFDRMVEWSTTNSGDVRWNIYHNAGNLIFWSSAGGPTERLLGSWPGTGFHTILVYKEAGSDRIYGVVDGVLNGSQSITYTSHSGLTGRRMGIADAYDGIDNCIFGEYYTVSVWKDRALPTRERQMLAQDPWAPFRLGHQRLWPAYHVGVGAGGASGSGTLNLQPFGLSGTGDFTAPSGITGSGTLALQPFGLSGTGDYTAGSVLAPPTITAPSAFVSNVNTGKAYYTKDGANDRAWYSLIKAITGRVLRRYKVTSLELAETVTIEAGDIEVGTGNNLQAGDVIDFQNLLTNLWVPSSNTSAQAIARVIGDEVSGSGGGEAYFRNTLMVAEANRLGLTTTVFDSVSGQSASQQLTAEDCSKVYGDLSGDAVIEAIWGLAAVDIDITRGGSPTVIPVTSGISDILDNEGVQGAKGGVNALGNQNNMVTIWDAPSGDRIAINLLRCPTGPDRITDTEAIIAQIVIDYPELIAAPVPASFDGLTHLTYNSSLTGVTDGRSFTGSFKFRRTRTGIFETIFAQTVGLLIRFQLDDRLEFIGADDLGTTLLSVDTTAITDTVWHDCCYSFDLDDPARAHVYIDDQDAINQVTTFTPGDMDFTNNYAIGGSLSGIRRLDGDLANLWMEFNLYVDLSQVGLRRAFMFKDAVSSIDFGTNGENPTGASPDLYFAGDIASWHTNKGTGGGFTEVGALTEGASRPAAYADPGADGDGSLAMQPFGLSGTGTVTFDVTGTGTLGLQPFGLDGTGNTPTSVEGTGALAMQPFGLSGVGSSVTEFWGDVSTGGSETWRDV